MCPPHDSARFFGNFVPFLPRSFSHTAASSLLAQNSMSKERIVGGAEVKVIRENLSIPSFNYQMTPKISLNTRCSISISENLSINGQTRSSDQLGIWSYNINP